MIDHYENPRNVGSMSKNDNMVGTGLVGAPACGDVMKLQIKMNKDGEGSKSLKQLQLQGTSRIKDKITIETHLKEEIEMN